MMNEEQLQAIEEQYTRDYGVLPTAARTAVPALVAEVRRLRAQLAGARTAALAYRVLAETCPECTGTGEVEGNDFHAWRTGESTRVACPMCNGTGKRPTTPAGAE